MLKENKMKVKKTLEEKIQKDNPEFAAEVAGLSVDELNKRLALLAKDAEAVSESKEADEELENTRALLTQLTAPYRDAQKSIRLKSRFVISLIKDKGE
jgi:uncharacterized small protein (DUF1192 family)